MSRTVGRSGKSDLENVDWNSRLKLIVLGASGGCGNWVVRLASDRGYDVTAVVRLETSYAAPADVTVKRGQLTDSDFVRSILTGQRVIISCLGLRRAGSSPWATLLSPPDLIERVMGYVIQGVSDPGGSRLIWISAGGVGSSRLQANWLVRMMIRAGNVGVAYRDLEAAERMMERDEIDSLAVRPVTLVPGPPTGKAGPVGRYGLRSTIRRSDVAHWMLDVAEGKQSYVGKNVLLGRASY